MKLIEFLASNAVKQNEFAARIGEKTSRVNKYCLGTRIPRPDVMRKIFDATNGAVSPNDFFDLPINVPPDVASAAAEPAADGVAEGVAAFPANDDAEPSFFDNLTNGVHNQ